MFYVLRSTKIHLVLVELEAIPGKSLIYIYLECFFNTDTSKTVGLHDNAQTFMIKVVHDISEAMVHLADNMALGNFNL